VAYTEYCLSVRIKDPDYATSLCKYLYVTLDAAARELALQGGWEANIGTKFFFLPAALPAALQAAATAAGVTDIPTDATTAVFRGYGEARSDKKAYVAEVRCRTRSHF
jgi:hypothetical protein